MSDSDIAEQLLADAAWLRALALTLAGNAVDADDLVQESWIAVWKRKPDASRPLRPWLAKVLRDVSGMQRRSKRRRDTREQVAGGDPQSAPSADALLDQVRVQRLLADLVINLDEPYRSTIISRFVEGRTCAEIARSSGLSASTVRWRLREGLARLRAGLDVARGERKAWAPAVLAFAKGGVPVAKATKPALLIIALLLFLLVGGSAVVFGILSSSSDANANLEPVPATSAENATSQSTNRDLRSTKQIGPRLAWLAALGTSPRPIAGRVVDSAGQPVAGARVDLQGWTSAFGDEPEARVITRNDGRFQFKPRAAWNYVVIATAADRTAAVASVDSRAPRGSAMINGALVTMPVPDELVLVLEGCGSRVEGLVTDAGGGPIVGATIQDLQGLAGPFGPAATTDRDGHYSLCLSSGEHRLMYGADGYEHVFRTLRAEGRHRVDVGLVLGATVSGKVVDEDTGTPLADVQVNLWPWTWESGAAAHRSGFTGADGTFEIRNVGAGRFEVTSWASDHALMRAEAVTVEPGQNLGPVVLRLRSGVEVTGKVVADGKPVAGAIITISTPSIPPVRTLRRTTNDDGTFAIRGVPRHARAKVDVQGYDVLSPSAIDTNGPAKNLVVTVAATPKLRGRVVSNGRPVASAEVALEGESFQSTARSDAAGRFELIAPHGSYTLSSFSAALGASSAARTVLVPSSDEITLDLSRTARITGSVVDRNGAPVIGAEVMATRQQKVDVVTAITTIDGTFTLVRLAGEGDYRLAVRPFPGAPDPYPFAGDPPDLISLPTGKASAGPIRIAIDRKRDEISGVVFDDSGVEVPDALVRLGPNTAQLPAGPAWPIARTNANGEFHLSTTGPGPFTVEASLGNGPRATLQGISPGATNLEVHLVRTGEVRGTLVGLPDANVWLRRISEASNNGMYLARVDGDHFVASKLTPGEYVVSASSGASPGDSATVTVESGKVVTLTLRSRSPRSLVGRIKMFGNGSPVAGVRCNAGAASGIALPPAPLMLQRTAISAADGTFAFDDAPAGDTIVFCSASADRTCGSALVHDGDNATIEVVSAFEAASTVGLRLDGTVIVPRVATVAPNSPAAVAEVKPGDIIVDIDGASVRPLCPDAVQNLIDRRKPGMRVTIRLDRGGAQLVKTLTPVSSP